MARVTVNVNVRDLTGNDLARLRSRFDGLTNSVNQFAGNRSQQNLTALRRQFADMDRDVRALAGHIPDDEFQRLTARVRVFGNQIRSAAGPQTQRQFGLMRNSLREIERDLNRFGAVTRHVRVAVRDDTERGLSSARRRIFRFATGPVRGLGGLIGGILSDGVGQGIIGAFRSPAFGTALVVAIVGALSMVGAAVAGALVFAIGGAFVGLGAMIALQAKGVKERWEKTLNGLKPIFKDAAESMIPVIDHARKNFDGIAREFAPHFKEALEKAAPHVETFVEATRRGLRKLGEGAWDKLQEAFRVFLDAFGPEWEDFLMELGKSLGKLADTVKNHSTEMAMALRIVLGVINGLIEIVNFLAQAWVAGIDFMIASVANLLNMFAMITDGFMGMIDGILGGLETVAGLIGLDGPIKQARENFNQLRDNAVGRMREIADQATAYGENIDYNNRERVLRVNIASWQSQLEQAKSDLKSVPPEKRSDLKANIADLERKIAQANGELAAMQKDYYVRIHAYKVGDWALVGGGGPGQAFGGITGNHIGRAATGGARANMTLVGEHGPELVNLAPGSHVRSNGDSRRMFSNSGGGSSRAVFEFKSSGRRADDLLLELLREAIHQRGGDPVTVLGGR